MSNVNLVDPRDYRSFCFRGEGRANFVISAKHTHTGMRIVWRFAKARKSGLITVKAKSELVNKYMERIVAPFFDEQYLVDTHIVEFSMSDVHHLAKIPSLLANQKIESFEELTRLPSELSFLPAEAIPKGAKKLSSLQMLDATRIPKSVPVFLGSTITVEVKPKQGFFQNHSNVNIPYCNNCILQMEKCGSDHYSEMYEFCPLDLFSGSFLRMRNALKSLFLVPHRNLRVFVDGNLVHSDELQADQSRFDEVLFPHGHAGTDDVIYALCLALSGSTSRGNFGLRNSSVLAQILAAQKVDTVGIVKALALYKALPASAQSELLDKTRLSRKGLSAILDSPKQDAENLLERYLVAATMKDCSIMVSLRLIPNDIMVTPTDLIALPNGLKFAYTIKIVDLDPKSPKNLINAHARFLAGVKMIRLELEQGQQHKPCVSE